MANQESRLAIVIDTSKADKPLKSLSAKLKKFEQDSLKAVKGVSSLGESNALAKLSKSINSTKTAMDKLLSATTLTDRNIAKLKGTTHAPVMGATLAAQCKVVQRLCFNPRTRDGCDLVTVIVIGYGAFQSTHP